MSRGADYGGKLAGRVLQFEAMGLVASVTAVFAALNAYSYVLDRFSYILSAGSEQIAPRRGQNRVSVGFKPLSARNLFNGLGLTVRR